MHRGDGARAWALAASILLALQLAAADVAIAQTGQNGAGGQSAFGSGPATPGNGGAAGLAGDGSSTGTNGGPGATSSGGTTGGAAGGSDLGGGGGGGFGSGAAGGGGGGAGGAGTTVSASGTTIISTNATGGIAGSGGVGASTFGAGFNVGGGGGGGGGGSGIIVNGSASGVAISINSGVVIQGGAAGNGSNPAAQGGLSTGSDAGRGGNGGNGITVSNGNGAAITNNGTITGGSGGAGGLAADFTHGANGSNGVGIVGANLTVINAGSISGGNAIVFTGGTNSLELRAGFSFSGAVQGGGTNTLKLGGTTGASFDISQLGSIYQNFSQFQKTGTATWSVTGTSGTTLAWTISTGTLNLVGAGATTGAMVNSATLGIDATSTLTATGITNNSGGVLTVSQGGSASGTIDNAGTVTNSGTFNSVVHTNTAGTITNDTTGQWTGNVTSNAAAIVNNGIWIGNVVANTGSINNNLTWTGTVTNSATFNNNANGTVSGLLTNSAGTTTNNGSLNGGASVTGGLLTTFTTINLGASVTGGTLTTIGTINGGLTNGAAVNAAGAVNDGITNQGAGLFTVTAALTTNNSVTNQGAAQLAVSGGDFTGITTLTNNSTNATGVSIAAGRTLSATNVTNSAGATLSNSGTLTSANTITNDGMITNNTGAIINGGVSNGGTFNNSGTLNNGLTNTSGSATNNGTINGGASVSGGTLFLTGGGSVAGTVNLSASGGKFDISGTTTGATVAMLNGVAGSTVNLGNKTLTITTGSTFDGLFQGTGGNLTLSGGTETLTGTNTYGGATTINGGTLSVTGAITNSNNVTVNGGTLNVTGSVSDPTVNAGGLLTGTGSVGDTTINAGGTFAPGTANSPGTSMTVAGNLAFTSGALYVVYLNPTTTSFATVTGTATLGGATVNALYASGSYINKQYTILTATGGVSGTFGTLVNTNLPSNFKASLSYDSHDAYLNLALNFTPGPTPGPSAPDYGSGLNFNQQNVAKALVNFFNTTGGIPLVFGSLTPTGLAQVSGESATGSQQTTFSAMSQFLGVLTDPFVAGRGDSVSAGASPAAYTEESMADVARGRTASERDAYAAVYTKAPVPTPFEQRWSVWAAGFGGSEKTNGDPAVAGTNDVRSSLYGTAVGADYRISPDTLAGFALAGGGTSFGVNTLGSGRSDLFQAGAFIRHNHGPAYFTGAIAYGWQGIITDRTVALAGFDRLHAAFNANAWSSRVEGGYRFTLHGFGITPYAAGQSTTFDLPAYAEQALAGTPMFALNYASKDVTDTRSELGIRTDKSFVMQNGIFTLRGRFAWAHDFDPDRSVLATFQSLPGASFVVNGAQQASDSALTTASAEWKWINGWSAAATFEGEFSNSIRSYAGKGVVRYAW